MRVLHLNRHTTDAGGAEVYIRELSARQAAAGHVVSLAIIGEDFPTSGGLLSGAGRRAASLAAVARHRPHVVHLHGIYGRISPLVLRAIATRWPTVATLHDVAPLCFRDTKIVRDGTICRQPLGVSCLTSGCHRPLREHGAGGAYDTVVRAWQWHELGRLPALVASSRYFVEEAARAGVAASRLHRIPLFSRWPSSAAPLHAGTPSILFVGRLSEEKGPAVFIAALARLAASAWTATMVGEGPEAQRTRAAIEAHGLHNRVVLRGRVDGAGLEQLYRAARVVVVPSTGPEAFSLVGVEAMAFGRPVVASAAGGITDWCADGDTGLLVPPGDAEALAHAVARLLVSPELAARFGAAGSLRVAREFSAEAHLEALDGVYASIVGGATTGAASPVEARA